MTLIKIPNTYIGSTIELKKKILFAFNFWILFRENYVLKSLFPLPLRIYSFKNSWSTSYCWIYMLEICLKNPFFHWNIYFYHILFTHMNTGQFFHIKFWLENVNENLFIACRRSASYLRRGKPSPSGTRISWCFALHAIYLGNSQKVHSGEGISKCTCPMGMDTLFH